MTTYKTKDGQTLERYEKFTTKHIATLTWIPLLVGENRVRYFEASQLTEVKSPFDSGMVYCYPAIPQNFDSGLLYTCAEPPKALTVIMPVSAAEAISHTNVRILKFADVSLWHSGMRAA